MIWLGSFWSRPQGKPPIVSIACWNPQWFTGSSIRELAPENAAGQRIRHTDRRKWIESYKGILSERERVRKIRKQLDALLLMHSSIMLACWCKVGRNRRDDSYSGNFCHRLLAGRLLFRLGYIVEVIDIECPRCQKVLSFDGGLVAGEFVCRECRSSFCEVS